MLFLYKEGDLGTWALFMLTCLPRRAWPKHLRDLGSRCFSTGVGGGARCRTRLRGSRVGGG